MSTGCGTEGSAGLARVCRTQLETAGRIYMYSVVESAVDEFVARDPAVGRLDILLNQDRPVECQIVKGVN